MLLEFPDHLLLGLLTAVVFIFLNVSMSIAAFLTHSVRSRVDVLTSREFTTVARSLHSNASNARGTDE